MLTVLDAAGIEYSTFTALDDPLWFASTVIIPELEMGELSSAMSSTIKEQISDHVSTGGLYVVGHVAYHIQNHYCGSYCAEVDWVNDVFGLSLSAPSSCGATGDSFQLQTTSYSAFDDASSTLYPYSNTLGIDASSLPDGAYAVYSIGSCVTMAVIPFGSGYIVTLGYDWYSSSSSDWNGVLAAALQLT